MKRTFITFISALVLFLASSEQLCAQRSMLDGDPVWVYRQEVWFHVKNAPEDVMVMFGYPVLFYHTYYIKGDTTINNRVYKKLYHEYLNENGEYAFGTQGAELVTPIREEGDKILVPRDYYQKQWGDADWYFEMPGSTANEIKIYDFEMFLTGYKQLAEPSSVELIDKTSRKVFSFGDNNQVVQVIDGIGCSQNNVLLFAPFGNDRFLVPNETEAEMTVVENSSYLIPYYNIQGSTSNSQIYYCTWDWGKAWFCILNKNMISTDSSWVTSTADGKMMVSLEKTYESSTLRYYVQNGKIAYQYLDNNNDIDPSYDFVEKYLNYHINDEEEMVDLGLSVKWSTHNVGAASPTDFGQYFCWGDTTGIIAPTNRQEEVPYTGHYQDFDSHLQNHIAKTKYDAAYQLQGKNWRMPTAYEFRELVNNCTSVRIRVNDVYGYLLTGPNGNTLFLPGAEGLRQGRDGMRYNEPSEHIYSALYWTEEAEKIIQERVYNVYIYNNNRIESDYRNNNWTANANALKALPIRAVYDESGDKWLSVKEYLYYDRYDLIEWGWNEEDVVIPTIDACNGFLTRHKDLFDANGLLKDKVINVMFCEHYRKYIANRLEAYKARAIETYEGSDGKTLYFVDWIDDDFLDYFDTQIGRIDLLTAINLEEDAKGSTMYTKNCTYTMEDIDPKFGVPDNQYIRVIPQSDTSQPYITFNLPVLMANTNYTLRITMAPETFDSIAPLGNQFRINMFIKNRDGQWPKTRNYVYKNPLDPTGKEQNFTSSADTLTVIDLPLTLDYATDVMVQLQSYVSSAETKTYTRHLRIANIEIIKQDTQNNENVQNDSLAQYLPFVQAGKRWTVNQSYVGKENLDEMTYALSYDEVSENGNQYYSMSRSLNGNLVDDEPFMIREKNRKVYLHFPYTEYEYLLFDYSLKAGDTYWTYSLDEQKAVEYEVLSVSDFTDGPEFVYREYDEKGDSMKTYARYLRKWVVERINKPIQKTWIEGIGSIEGPLANFYDAARTSGRDYLAYVELGRLDYLPFEFNDTVNYRWHGCNLPTGAEDNWEEDFHKLTYELEGDRLHVYGEALTQCGPNNYAYFKEEPTDDPLTYRIRFYIQEVEPTMDCMALHATNFYVSGFNPNLNYIIVDNHGEEHPVINKTPQMAYRPFIEDGKVWKVKVISDGWPKEEWIDYYYFDGDTIIGGQLSKRMMCVKGDHIEYKSPENIESVESGKYIGAWYEQDKKVYFASNHQEQFELLYDFTLSTGDSIQTSEQLLLVNKASGGIPGFKGTYYKIGDVERWLEGVGSETFPHANFSWNGNIGALIACCVGDEVIYFNEQLADKLSYDNPAYAKKRRFDFNHTINTQPKAPERRAEAVSLYGEYNDQLLDINLNPLDEAYLVRITDKSGKVVYEKAVNASTIVALNIDISKYPEGQYTITIDNSNETFNGVFDTTTTGIAEIVNGKSSNSKSIYNLQGQRINAPQKGLNIMDGKKIFVK